MIMWVLKLRRADRTWDNGWIVVEVWATQPGHLLEVLDRTRRVMTKKLSRDGGVLV
jgi:hypothetical protein